MIEVNVAENKAERFDTPTKHIITRFKEIAKETYTSLIIGIVRLIQLLLIIILSPLIALLLIAGRLCYKFLRWFSEYRTTGVYLDGDDLTYVELARTKSGEPELRGYATRDVSRDHKEAGSPDPDTLKVALSQVLSMGSVACFGGHGIHVKSLYLPKMTQAELKANIMWEAEQCCPWDIDETFVDYHIINPDAGTDLMEILLIFANKQDTRSFTFSLNRARHYPDRLGVAAIALANVVNFTQNTFNGQTVIVNVDEQETLIVSLEDGIFNYETSIQGAEHLINKLQRMLTEKAIRELPSTSTDPAEKLPAPSESPDSEPNVKACPDLDEMTENFDAAMEIANTAIDLQEQCTPSIQEVHDTLSIFSAGGYLPNGIIEEIKKSVEGLAQRIRVAANRRCAPANLIPRRAFLCGKYHNLPGLKAEIGEELGVIVEILDPTRNILVGDYIDEKALEHSAPALAIPIGMALRAIDKPART